MAKKLRAFIAISIAALLLVGCSGAGASYHTTVNGQTISWISDSQKAVKKADMELIGDQNQMLIDLTESEAKQVKITLTGKNTGKSYSASNDDIISDGINWVKNLVGASAVAHGEGNSFYINANIFEDGEIVVVEASFITSNSKLDEAFGKGAESMYWAFIAKHSEDAPAETEPGDADADVSDTGTETGDANTDTGDTGTETGDEGTETPPPSNDGIIDKIGGLVNGLTSDTSIDADGVSGVTEEPQGKLLYNGKELPTYASQTDAEYADEVQKKFVFFDGPTEIQGIPILNVHSITIKIETSNGGETAVGAELNAGNEWKSTLDLSEFDGQRVLMRITYKGAGIIPTTTPAYVIIQCPAG